MDSRFSSLAAAALAFVVGATPVAPPQGVPSAHWKTTVTTEGARPGEALEEAEIWLQGGAMRIVERGKGPEKTNVLRINDEVYIWTEGQSAGLKLLAGLAASGGRPSHEYVRRIEEIRSRGKKLGSETVGGHACDVYALEGPVDGEGRYWLATDLQGFPVRAVVEKRVFLPSRPTVERNSVKLEYRNTDIQIPGKIPAGTLSVPQDVRFQDASEMILTGRPPRR
jgi:hypothetical protein